MSIAFSCEHCGKKIEAPDSTAGKWGRCSGCHNKVHVPELQADEELKLAPIDEGDSVKQKQLLAETYQLTQNILEERGGPAGLDEPAGISVAAGSDEQLTTNIIMYLRQMADGELDQAEMVESSIVSCGGRARKILKEIAHSEPPEPELADIPEQVLSGLIKTLRSKIS